ncbi:MAG TPA: hypothetical protein VFA45_10360 [Actinomycetes bacterium]|jgi:hypothetical protein|nr:hypothetical protein [Actinomycetes bacterium]
MTVVAWLALGTALSVVAAVAVLAGFRPAPVRLVSDSLARQRRAKKRAEALLLSWLSPRQLAQYRVHGWFDVLTPGGNRYRIRPGRVVRLDVRRCSYCIEATPWVPAADQMLAKKLLLETDERRFLATAHRYR